jgi:enoyl-CoA hydratase/carnithine racemase
MDSAVNTPDALVTRDGPIMTLTFNRPQTRNAMTWAMYERLLQVCEEVDADDSVRVLVLRGAGGKAFVAGTDISQFKVFETAEDGLAYERDGAARAAPRQRVKKPLIAQIQGFAVGGGFNITACCDIRIATPDAKFGAPIARTLGNCLSMETYARFVDLLGTSVVKDVIFRARFLTAQEALAAGYVHEIVAPEEIDARVKAIALEIADHAPITLQVTKESLRRIRDHGGLPDGDDLVARTYTSADFREGAAAFIEKRKPRWTGK